MKDESRFLVEIDPDLFRVSAHAVIYKGSNAKNPSSVVLFPEDLLRELGRVIEELERVMAMREADSGSDVDVEVHRKRDLAAARSYLSSATTERQRGKLGAVIMRCSIGTYKIGCCDELWEEFFQLPV